MLSRLPAQAKRKCIILSIFNGGGRPKWRFSNFPRFWKNSSALGSFNCIFENNSLKTLFGKNMKKLKILKLSPDFRYLQKLALNYRVRGGTLKVEQFWIAPIPLPPTIKFTWTNNTTLTVTGGEQNANRNFVNENFDNPVNLKKRKPTKQGNWDKRNTKPQ